MRHSRAAAPETLHGEGDEEVRGRAAEREGGSQLVEALLLLKEPARPETSPERLAEKEDCSSNLLQLEDCPNFGTVLFPFSANSVIQPADCFFFYGRRSWSQLAMAGHGCQAAAGLQLSWAEAEI